MINKTSCRLLYLVAISWARASFSFANCKSALRTQNTHSHVFHWSELKCDGIKVQKPFSLVLISVPDIREILLDWDVVDPGLELRVEELQPLVSNMKHQRTAEEEMFEAKAGSHASEVEQIPRGAQTKVRPRR